RCPKQPIRTGLVEPDAVPGHVAVVDAGNGPILPPRHAWIEVDLRVLDHVSCFRRAEVRPGQGGGEDADERTSRCVSSRPEPTTRQWPCISAVNRPHASLSARKSAR